jgi:simple sugar transport system ATP-binding protein
VVSSEIDEVAAYSNRVLVMRDRRPAGVLADPTPQDIMAAIAGRVDA